MSSKEEFEETIKEISIEFLILKKADSRVISDVSKFISRVYAFIWSSCAEDSPYLRVANCIIDANTSSWDKAQELQGVISEMGSDCLRSGYFSPIEEKEHYKSYDKFSSAVRNWLIAYGIAGPAVLIAEEKVLEKIIDSNHTLAIGILFFGGVLLQVLRSILYKATSWYAMDYKYVPDKKATRWMKFSVRINDNMLIDILVDLVAILMFMAATLLVLSVIG